MSDASQARVLRFEVVIGTLYVLLIVLIVAAGVLAFDARNAIRDENVQANEIRSIENCNEIEKLKLSIRAFLTTIDLDRVSREAAEQSFSPIPGGSFINERGDRQWRGCGEFPEPIGG